MFHGLSLAIYRPARPVKKKYESPIKNEGRVGVFRLLEKLLGFPNHTGKLWSQISLIRVWSGWLWVFLRPLASVSM